MHAILTEAFADDWGYHPEPFDEWADDYRQSPNYDPRLWLLAKDGGPARRRAVRARRERARLDR